MDHKFLVSVLAGTARSAFTEGARAMESRILSTRGLSISESLLISEVTPEAYEIDVPDFYARFLKQFAADDEAIEKARPEVEKVKRDE